MLEAEREMWDAIVAQAAPATVEPAATVRAGYRQIVARFPGYCDSCGGPVRKGETVLHSRRHELRLLCTDCGARADAGEELELCAAALAGARR